MTCLANEITALYYVDIISIGNKTGFCDISVLKGDSHLSNDHLEKTITLLVASRVQLFLFLVAYGRDDESGTNKQNILKKIYRRRYRHSHIVLTPT